MAGGSGGRKGGAGGAPGFTLPSPWSVWLWIGQRATMLAGVSLPVTGSSW